MPLMAWIDYSLIVVFFALVAGLVAIVSRAQQKGDVATSFALPAVRQNKTAYAFLAILCLFLLSITLLSSKRTHK